MKVFVTGAAGFVGLNIVRALLDEGHEVIAYVRPTTKLDFLSPLPVEIRKGELDDAAALQQGMSGAEAAIHCAGNTSCYRHDLNALRQTNVEGTRQVVQAALALGLRRLVFTSTTSTIGAQDNPRQAVDESAELKGFRKHSPYAMTKSEAERIVLDAQSKGLQTIILNPAEVIGAYDHNLQWGRMVLAACVDQVPFLPPGSASFCAADEVGRAHVAALTRGEPGSRYILAGTDASFTEFLDTVFEVVGRRARVPDVPYPWLRWKAQLQVWMAPVTRRLPAVDPYRMRVFGGHYFFRSDRAIRDLGYRARPLKEMVNDCYAWYRANGFLPT